MEVSMSLSQLQMLLRDAAEVGAQRVVEKLGLSNPVITRNKAYKIYGEALVSRWIREGLITPKRDGSNTAPFRLDVTALEVLAKSSNRHSFLKTKGL